MLQLKCIVLKDGDLIPIFSIIELLLIAKFPLKYAEYIKKHIKLFFDNDFIPINLNTVMLENLFFF